MTINDLVFIDSTGYNYADFPTFLTWLQDQYKGIYGADVYLGADSQDGQFLAILAQAFFDTAALGASVYNSFSPITAQGTGLSRVVKINGLNRGIPAFSTVTLTIIGQAGIVINNGVAQDTIGQLWNLPNPTTIPDAGTIDVVATAQVAGALNAQADTITTIFTPTLGWQTVNNAGAATPGAPVESDAELRRRQAISTADPSLTVFEGTIGGVSNVPGVTEVRGYENDTGITDANSLPPHSIAIVVAGGTDQAVADEIMLHKTPGTQTYGTTNVNVVDAHGMPLIIHFFRPTPATISVRITLAAGVGWSTDFEDLIAAAVAAAVVAGGIGNTILYTKLFAPAYLNGAPEGLTYTVSTIELKKNAGSFAAANVDLTYIEEPVCDPLTNFTFIVT